MIECDCSNVNLLSVNLQFFAKEGPGGEKTEPATSKKLNDVRKEGQVAKSKELITAVMLLALFIVIKLFVGNVGKSFIRSFNEFYSILGMIVSGSGQGLPMNLSLNLLEEAITSLLIIALPFFLSAVVVSVLLHSLQQRWMITAKPMKPKMSKISPVSGFKRLFSVSKLVELLKSIAMLVVIGVVTYMTIKDKLSLLLTFYGITLYEALGIIGDIIIELGIKISVVFLVIGFVDLLYQRHKFKNDNKMTKQEVKDEYKNSEGDPQVKGQIRKRMMEVSRRRMMEALPEADVVITNPTHFAVALKYEPNVGKAPVVVAKGADYLAFQIRDKAKEYNIEIVENRPLARILYNNVDIGAEIPPELYQVVAEILAKVLQSGKKDIANI